MALIIRNGKVETDPWSRLEAGPDGALPAVPVEGDVIVPLATWRGQRARLLDRPGRLGLWLDSHEEPGDIAEDLRLFGVVAVNFPKFGDGRGFSSARLLRERYGWRGELRAIGDIFRDQLFYLASVGFDSFVLRADEDPHEALEGFKVFSESYQASVERPLPLFRRREPASAERAKAS